MVDLLANLKQLTEARAPEVALVTGGLFFCRSLPLPEEVDPEEYVALAELALEEHSPFPLEQLAWGYVVDQTHRELWYYAACRPRIASSLLERWELAHHVFPAFLPLVLDRKESPPHVFVWYEHEVFALTWAPGARFPHQVRAQALSAEAEDESDAPESTPEERAAEALDTLRRRLGVTDESPVYTVRGAGADEDGQVLFHVAEGLSAESPARDLLLGDSVARWAADLRPAEFIVAEQRSRRWQDKLWQAMQVAGWAAVALVILALLTFGGNRLVQRRDYLIAAQAPGVVAVEQNAQFLNDLRQFSERPLRPFEVLGLTNLIRPERSIVYRAASVDTGGGVTIQGYGNQVDDINVFVNKLVASGDFQLRTDPTPSYRPRDGKMEFTLRLDFTGSLDPVADAPVVPVETAPASEEVGS